MITIRFDGEMELRGNKTGKDVKGKLYLAHAGDVVYSKIDVRNGAIGIVPEILPTVAVTSEFPVYEVCKNVALPMYIQLLFWTVFFRRTINSMISGASGRKRVQPTQLVDVEVPLPPLHVQQAIIDRWQQAQMEIAAAKESMVSLEKQIQDFIQNKLGIATNLFRAKPRAFALQWHKLERWGVEMCWKTMNKPTDSTFSKARIKDICRMGSGGTPSRNIPAYYVEGEIPWVKTTEVKNGVITSTEEKITLSALKNSSAKLYPSGILIVAMYGQGVTRGRTAKLAIEAATNQACCVLYDFSPNVEPDFLWFYLMSEYENLRGMASGNNQPNLNAEMIANYEVPLPPLEFQKDLVKEVQMRRASIKATREAVTIHINEIKADIEAMILGTKKVVVETN